MKTLLTAASLDSIPRTAEPVANHAIRTRPKIAVPPRARILFVDDDPQVRSVGELVLVRSGYEVNTAANGLHGWEVLQHSHYNLLITAHKMPGLTGLELAGNARMAGMRLPIMMTSSSLSPLQDPVWTRLGIAALLPKPFALESLLSTVERVLLAANNGLESRLIHIARSIQPFRHGGINE